MAGTNFWASLASFSLGCLIRRLTFGVARARDQWRWALNDSVAHGYLFIILNVLKNSYDRMYPGARAVELGTFKTTVSPWASAEWRRWPMGGAQWAGGARRVGRARQSLRILTTTL